MQLFLNVITEVKAPQQIEFSIPGQVTLTASSLPNGYQALTDYLTDLLSKTSPEALWAIPLDFQKPYLRFDLPERLKKVRKNVTIPQSLNQQAEAHHLNFSAILTAALQQRLAVFDE